MLLNNYRNWIFAAMTKGSYVYTSRNGVVRTTDFSTTAPVSTDGFILTRKLGTVNTVISSEGVCFGDGDTPPTLDDYGLSGNVITGIAGTASVTTADDGDYRVITATYTITNNNSSEIVIKELLYTARMCLGLSSNYSDIALDRTVLDEPLTVAAGGVGQVVFKIRVKNPFA